LRDAMGIEGDGPEAVAKVLQLTALLPWDYVDTRVQLVGDVVTVTVDGTGLDDRSTPSPLDHLGVIVEAVAQAVDPQAAVEPAGERTWTVRHDSDAPDAVPHPMADIVGAHNIYEADLGPREVPVALRGL